MNEIVGLWHNFRYRDRISRRERFDIPSTHALSNRFRIRILVSRPWGCFRALVLFPGSKCCTLWPREIPTGELRLPLFLVLQQRIKPLEAPFLAICTY
jgi:hypothetical protein